MATFFTKNPKNKTFVKNPKKPLSEIEKKQQSSGDETLREGGKDSSIAKKQYVTGQKNLEVEKRKSRITGIGKYKHSKPSTRPIDEETF